MGSTGTVLEVEPSGATSPVTIALPDPGVGIDVGDDGRIELAFATGERVSVDPQSGSVDDLPSFDYSEQDISAAAAPHVVAIAHNGRGRFGIDATADVLVAIADDGTLTTIGPLGIDVSDGASLDIAADGTAYLASPGSDADRADGGLTPTAPTSGLTPTAPTAGWRPTAPTAGWRPTGTVTPMTGDAPTKFLLDESEMPPSGTTSSPTCRRRRHRRCTRGPASRSAPPTSPHCSRWRSSSRR